MEGLTREEGESGQGVPFDSLTNQEQLKMIFNGVYTLHHENTALVELVTKELDDIKTTQKAIMEILGVMR